MCMQIPNSFLVILRYLRVFNNIFGGYMCSLSTCQVNDFIKEKLGQVVLVLNAEFTYTSWQEVLTTLEGDKKTTTISSIVWTCYNVRQVMFLMSDSKWTFHKYWNLSLNLVQAQNGEKISLLWPLLCGSPFKELKDFVQKGHISLFGLILAGLS